MSDGSTFSAPHADLEERAIFDLQNDLTSGRYSAQELTQAYLDRISALNADGPMLRAVIETNPEAIAIAEQLDNERRSGNVRGPLHGIPILIKDNIDSADQMLTTAGSLALRDSRPAEDATMTARLRAAGAIVLGKANLSEWANFRSISSSSGWSGRGGQCLNPYQLDRTPSGSSSGSGVAAAANLAAGTLGSETDGSILSPSNASGVVGIKPTVGLTSRAGVIPISASQDTVGPQTRTVADAAIILAAVAGRDPRDAATLAGPVIDWNLETLLDRDGLRGARIGVARTAYWGSNGKTDEVAENALQVLRDAGAEVVDPANIPTALEIAGGWPPSKDDQRLTVLLYEFKDGLNRYLAGRSSEVKHLADLIAFNNEHADLEMPFFRQEIFEMAEECGPLTDARYLEALARNRRVSREEGIDAVLREHRLDALVMPTSGPASKIDFVSGGGGGASPSTPAALAGYPAITVPMGFVYGMPVGLCFLGTAWSEPTLIKLAYAYEQASLARRPPTYTPAGVLPPSRDRISW
jgi:amidase